MPAVGLGLHLDDVELAVVGSEEIEREMAMVAEVLDDAGRCLKCLWLVDRLECDAPSVLDSQWMPVRAVGGDLAVVCDGEPAKGLLRARTLEPARDCQSWDGSSRSRSCRRAGQCWSAGVHAAP